MVLSEGDGKKRIFVPLNGHFMSSSWKCSKGLANHDEIAHSHGRMCHSSVAPVATAACVSQNNDVLGGSGRELKLKTSVSFIHFLRGSSF